MWDRAYGNKLYVLFFCLFLKKWLKNYWHFVAGETEKPMPQKVKGKEETL